MRIHPPLTMVLFLLGCGADVTATRDADTQEYGDGWDVVGVAGQEEGYVITGAESGGCVSIEGSCLEVSDLKARHCDSPDALADIVIDESGEVLGAVCYPSPEEASGVEDALVATDDTLELPQSNNGAVITFPESSEGATLTGDVTLSAERVTLFGRGLEETLIDGNVTLSSNNARLRGMTINRDLAVSKNANNTGVSFVRVRGDLKIEGNNATVLNAQVFGDVQLQGKGAAIVNLGVQGAWQAGEDATCLGCYSFEDQDQDGTIQDTERGEEFTKP